MLRDCEGRLNPQSSGFESRLGAIEGLTPSQQDVSLSLPTTKGNLMIWILIGYAVIAALTMVGWAIWNDNWYSGSTMRKDIQFITASGVLWPIHLLWTIVRGSKKVFTWQRGEVQLTRKQKREILYQKEKNAALAEYNRLIGIPN